jgi:hypothetical protein
MWLVTNMNIIYFQKEIESREKLTKIQDTINTQINTVQAASYVSGVLCNNPSFSRLPRFSSNLTWANKVPQPCSGVCTNQHGALAAGPQLLQIIGLIPTPR